MTFTAQYRGQCGADCGSAIKEGQEVEYATATSGDLTAAVLVHAVCPDSVPEPARGVCPSCRLELPVTGECGTCE